MNIEYKNGLQAPVVPVADAEDGLVNIKYLESPLTATICLWEDAQPGDFVQLLFDGKPVGAITTLSAQDISAGAVSMQLDPQYLTNEGRYLLRFRATNAENMVSDDSPSRPLLIDRTAPGASLVAPMIFPDVTLAENLLGTVPGYAGMQAGDIIQSLCNGIEGATYRVRSENMTTRPVEVTFRREFLQSLDSEEVVIDYYVTDRAGNRSMTAQPVTLSLQM